MDDGEPHHNGNIFNIRVVDKWRWVWEGAELSIDNYDGRARNFWSLRRQQQQLDIN